MIKFKLNEAQAKLVLDKIAGRFAFKIQREIIERLPKSFMNKINVVHEGNKWIVGSNDNVFIFFELGTRPHEIEANFKDALSFKWPKMPDIPGQPGPDGKYRFKKVKHPGTKGRRLLDELAGDTYLLNKLLEEAMQEVLT